MSVPLKRDSFPPDWAGLYSRRQKLPSEGYYAEVARNVQFFGGAIAKRGGTNVVNGWTAVTLAGWTTTVGSVDDASGFLASDSVTFFGIGTRTVLSVVGNVVTLTAPLPSAPGANVQVVTSLSANGRSPGNLLSRIDALFQALWRDGTTNLLAIYGGDNTSIPMDVVDMKAQPTSITRAPPSTTVNVNWGGPTTGTLTTVESLQVGDTIRVRVGATAVTRGQSVVSSVVGGLGGTVVVNPPFAGTPQAADVVEFMGSVPTAVRSNVHLVQYANLTHLFSDTYQPRKVRKLANGTLQVERHGVRPPTNGMTLAAGAAGTLNGTYLYRLKYRNSQTGAESESDNGLSAPITVANQQVNLSNLPVSPDPQVDKKRLYRTVAGGQAAWFLVTEMPNTAVVYTDNTADIALPTTPMRLFLDNAIPDTASVATLWPHANRLVAINGTSVIYSDRPDLDSGFLKGESWPVNNQIFVNYDDGDVITAIAPLFDSLLIFKRHSVWRVVGIPPNITIEPVSFRTDRTGIGCLSQKTLITNENEVMFAAQDGVYMVGRYTGVQQGFESRRLTRAIDDLYQGIVLGNSNLMHAVYFRQFRQLRLFVPLFDANTTDPTQCLVYQFEGLTPDPGSAFGWSQWDFSGLGTPDGITASVVVTNNVADRVYFAAQNGQVYTMDTGTHDSALVVTFQYKIKTFQPGGDGIPARGRRLEVAVSPQTAVGALPPTFQWDFDVDFNVSAATVTMGPVSAVDVTTKRALFLTRGVHHAFSVTEPAAGQPAGAGLFSAFRIHRFDYYSQPLPIETLPADAIQASVSYPN